MSTLSKKTKGQLVEIAEDLEIDISDCKVKKEVYDAVRDYFAANSDKFDENSKYYELAVLSKFGSPKKTVYIESDDADDGEVETHVEVKEEDDDAEVKEEEEDDDDDETEEAEDNDDGDDGDDDDAGEQVDEEEVYEVDLDYVYPLSLCDAIKQGTLREYFEDKNDELRDYLADPYTLNDLVFSIETAILLYTSSSTTSLDTYLPDTVLQYVPECVSQLPALSTETFATSNIAKVLVWSIVGKVLPLIFSYYVNFTYDFERDAFTEAICKLFLAIVVFKADIPISAVKEEIRYDCSLFPSIFSSANHYALESVLGLRNVFGNWVLIDALFISILALYGNLAFV